MITNDDQFREAITKARNEVDATLPDQPAKHVIIRYLNSIENAVHHRQLQYEAGGYINMRPIYEAKDGEKFLDTELGKFFEMICYYFVNTWWPAHKDEFKKEK
ncbi:MAG: hypothetical protein IT233_08550 [Bacteroidia bacterium]|nr:hypothetical protein [Bacteroidia bacterium]